MQELFTATVGKRVADHFYFHVSALASLPEELRTLVEQAAELAQVVADEHFNVVKVHTSREQLSLLAYDDFDEIPFPTLAKSWRIDVKTHGVVHRDYTQSCNPPILHRKELLVPSTDARNTQWAALTRTAELLGLFDETSRIGFREQWLELIAAKGYALCGDEFIPLANAMPPRDDAFLSEGQVARHLTALSRTNLSAPVQALWRHQLIEPGRSFFDYGCGKGDDVCNLLENGIEAAGWDPHFCPNSARQIADTVNLGFVINVIEEPDERMRALRSAYDLTRGVLAVAAMLVSQQPPDGRTYGDGYLTSRNTFQKYYSQVQLRDFIEHVLDETAIAVGPGVFFVFKDKLLEQHFLQRRYGKKSRHLEVLRRTAPTRATQPTKERRARLARPSREEAILRSQHAELRMLWLTHIQLGRPPQVDELTPALAHLLVTAKLSLSRALKLLDAHFDQAELRWAERRKRDDLLVFAAMSQFGERRPYRNLVQSLRNDVRYHFKDYQTWHSDARALLYQLTNMEELNNACVEAEQHGLGWLEDNHSLQLHTSLVCRLPAILRIYIGCATLLVGDLDDFDLVKIHIRSSKLSLMKYADFTTNPIPQLMRRVKVKLRELDLDIFEYGNITHPSPLLFYKSRFINEECTNFSEQILFEEKFFHEGLDNIVQPDITADRFAAVLATRRWRIEGFTLARSTDLPKLDAPCGRFFTYRQFIECGETQARTGSANRPLQPDTYSALYDLAVSVLDPVVDYFGMIELTYGFCSPELARSIAGRIAPKLDQHAAYELTRTGKRICERLGAACDFFVRDEDMEEVALWVAANTPFDRLYFYGKDRPIHVSYSPANSRQFIRMTTISSGAILPKVDRTISVFNDGKSATS